MAKAKAPPGVQNKHIYTRASYLYQAAAFLATASLQPKSHASPIKDANGNEKYAHDADKQEKDEASALKQKTPAQPPEPSTTLDERGKALRNMSRSLLADMRVVSLKLLIRHRPELKRSICRYCDSLLVVEAGTCDAVVENASRGGRKPWADVLVVRCRTCGGAKRFPVGEPRNKQLRKSVRLKVQENQEEHQGEKEMEEEKKKSDV
ncbi:hypothetical protein PWT90_08996 [Aphanocladium album]|nr:hypothetical protein PWT90_08996 [Aphanocladium album]